VTESHSIENALAARDLVKQVRKNYRSHDRKDNDQGEDASFHFCVELGRMLAIHIHQRLCEHDVELELTAIPISFAYLDTKE
jgi:hypothetical protein